MRFYLRYVLVSTILLFLCAAEVIAQKNSKAKAQSEADYLASIPPQAVPVYNMLKATETFDAKLFKSVWCSGTLKVWSAWGVKDYEATVRKWHKAYRKTYGKYDLRALTYSYQGDESSGIVTIIHQGKERDGLIVVREAGAWKLKSGD
jgi:hypothetical protein